MDGLDIFLASWVLSGDIVHDDTMTKHLRVVYGIHSALYSKRIKTPSLDYVTSVDLWSDTIAMA